MLDGHERALLQFSGGKDSTALLYLARPRLDRITVLFGDTGAVFPHVREHVDRTCERLGARLVTVRPPVPVQEYTAAAGLPADIVPVEADAQFAPFSKDGGPWLQPYMRCCSAMLFEPMARAIKESGATLVLRGSKAADARVGAPNGFLEDGIEYRSPLWDWSDADVMAYLDREGAELPAHYADVPDSLDCWLCSAHLAHHGAAKLRWMKVNTPDLYARAAARIGTVQGVLRDHAGRVAGALRVLET